MEQSTNSFSLRNFLDKTQEYFFLILRQWWKIGVVALVFGLGFYVKAKRQDINFIATHSFMVKEDEGSGSLFSNILGQFGLKSGGPKGDYNLDKLVEISKSKKIIKQTLLTEATLSGETDLLINHVRAIYGGDQVKRIEKKANYSREEQAIISGVYDMVVGTATMEGKLDVNYSSESGIIYLTFTTKDEELSRVFTKHLYGHLSEFYINQANEKQAITLQKLEEKRDSLHQVLVEKEYALAKMNDQGFGIILQKDKVKKSRLTSEIFLINTMYSELIKNVENAAFNLKNSTPVFQTIDEPQYPLRMLVKSTIKAAIVGCIVGALLVIGFIIGRKLFYEALEKEQD